MFQREEGTIARTELALAVIRRHSAGIERGVLASVEGPGDYDSLPRVLDLPRKNPSLPVASDATMWLTLLHRFP